MIDVPDNAYGRGRPCGWQVTPHGSSYYFCKHVELCAVCRKQFRQHFSWLDSAPGDRRFSLAARECPEFLSEEL